MNQTNEQARRAGIWTLAVVVIAAVIAGVYFFLPETAPVSEKIIDTAIVSDDHVKGSGPVVLMEYSDFQCPACKTYEPMVKKLLDERGGQITFVYRHFPLVTIHQNARLASEASEAAQLQGKFWEMHDKLFEGQESWSSDRNPALVFEAYAKDLGMNLEQFQRDLASSEVKDRVERDMTSGNNAQINGTPTFFINGAQFSNPRTYDEFKSAIDAAVGATAVEVTTEPIQ